MGELKHQLSMADERYNNRPSRPEDIHKIQQLETAVLDADERIKHLIVSRLYFDSWENSQDNRPNITWTLFKYLKCETADCITNLSLNLEEVIDWKTASINQHHNHNNNTFILK